MAATPGPCVGLGILGPGDPWAWGFLGLGILGLGDQASLETAARVRER
jgi:hypothetical protein